MKVVCCDCHRDMGEKFGPPELTTHGLCAACLAKAERELSDRIVARKAEAAR